MTSIAKSAEQQYKDIIENLSDPLHVINDKFEIIIMNGAMKKWLIKLGIDTNLIGSTIFEAFPFLAQKVHDEYDYVLREGKTLSTEEDISIFNKDIKTEIRKIPIITDGKVIQIITTIRNITKRKKAGQKLQESEEKFRTIAEKSSLGIAILQDNMVKYVNKRYADLVGNKVEDIISWKPGEFIKTIHPEDKNMVMHHAELRQKGLKDDINHYIYRGLKKNGELAWFEVFANTIMYKSKPADLAITLDITDKIKAEQKLKESKHKLRERVKELSCLFEISKITGSLNVSIEEMLHEVVDLLSSAFQYPDKICARIIYDGNDYLTSKFQESQWKISTYGIIRGKLLKIEIYYIQKEQFLEEESNLLNDIYNRLKTILEKKESEIALNLEKKFTEDIINSSMDTIFVFNPETGKAIRWNSVFNKVSGYNDEEISSSKAPDSYYSEEDLNRASEASKQVLEGGKTVFEMSLITKDGRRIPYEYTGTALHDPDGNVLIVSVGRDITEQKKAQQKLKDSEVIFRDLYEEAPNAYFSIGTDKSIIRTNKAAERLLGYTKEELLNMHVFDLYADTKHGLERAKAVFQRFLTGENIRDEELQMRTKNGELVWVSLTVKPIFNESGNVIESRSMILDISDRKLAQEELENSYKKLRELEYIVNNSPGVVFLWKNSEGWPVEMVSKNVKHFGYTPEDFYSGKVLYRKIIHPDDLEHVAEEVEIYSNEDIDEFGQEYRILTKRGEVKWIDDRTWIRRDAKGDITHFQGIVLDITDRKIAEEALKLSEKKYKDAFDRANFYKDLFAHDINNILQVVNSSAELISIHLGESDKSKDIKNISDIIIKQVDRGSKLVSNVRTLSDLEEKEFSTRNSEVCELLKKSIEYVKKAYNSREINILVDSVDKDYIIKANELLQDVFENILINGIKYNDHSKVDILIKITHQKIKDTKYLKIEFIDNGIGILDERKKIIFKSGNRELKGSKGMGLGLSLVSKILSIFNGKIRVEDRVKGDHTKGSNFVVLLPE